MATGVPIWSSYDYLKRYLWVLVEYFKLEIEVELAEVGRGSEVEMIWEYNEVLSECELDLCLIDIEDIAKLGLI
jgi:hypothetical protein